MLIIIDVPEDNQEIISQGVPLGRYMESLKTELWFDSVNMAGEYHGIWVKFKDIERIFDKFSGKVTK